MSHILIVRSVFYPDIADLLLQGALQEIQSQEYHLSHNIIDVPGALEVPIAINNARQHYDGAVALGCVIRGETSHYDIVCQTSANALMNIALSRNLVIINGIITTENKQQAIKRADPQYKNKGGYSIKACLDMMEIRGKV